MFDLALAMTLVVCLVRSVRVRFGLGIACAIGVLSLVGCATASALGSGLLRGHFGTAVGVFFVGPSAVPHGGALGNPLVVAGASCVATGLAAMVAGRAAAALPPDVAERWGRVELSFVAAFTFGAIRLLTALLFAALVS